MVNIILSKTKIQTLKCTNIANSCAHDRLDQIHHMLDNRVSSRRKKHTQILHRFAQKNHEKQVRHAENVRTVVTVYNTE